MIWSVLGAGFFGVKGSPSPTVLGRRLFSIRFSHLLLLFLPFPAPWTILVGGENDAN